MACYAISSIKMFTSLDVLRSTSFLYVHSIIFYGIIFWRNSSHSKEIFKIQKRIIMNSSKNASCQQLFKELNILPIQSHYIYSHYFYLLLKIKTTFCLTHKYIKSIQGKLPICTYLQQTWQYTKRIFIIRN
jgi:predicted AAA+ superfamily ATPase